MTITSPMAILLDTTPLGLLTHRSGHAQGEACRAWAASLHLAGCLFFVPEIADYELRRKLLHDRNAEAVARLDRFNVVVTGQYLPLTTPDVRLAAQLWAEARKSGRGGAGDEALDGDVLIAAQARRLVPADFGLSGTIVATANAKHFSALTSGGGFDAALWNEIRP